MKLKESGLMSQSFKVIHENNELIGVRWLVSTKFIKMKVPAESEVVQRSV